MLEPSKRGPNGKPLKQTTLAWCQTEAAHTVNFASQDPKSQWNQCRHVIIRSEDRCSVGSWIFAKSPLNVSERLFIDSQLKICFAQDFGEISTGRVVEILASPTHHQVIIILDVFEVSAVRHEIFSMPMLARRQSEVTLIAIPSSVCISSS